MKSATGQRESFVSISPEGATYFSRGREPPESEVF